MEKFRLIEDSSFYKKGDIIIKIDRKDIPWDRKLPENYLMFRLLKISGNFLVEVSKELYDNPNKLKKLASNEKQ